MEIIIYIIWNFAVFLLYGIDKRKSIKKAWRIKEITLILPAFFMGGVGAFLGMNVFRHKTKHLKFKILIPLAVIINLVIIYQFYALFILYFSKLCSIIIEHNLIKRNFFTNIFV